MKCLVQVILPIFSFVLVASVPMTFELDEEWYNVPTVDGEFKVMSRQEIIDEIENTPEMPQSRFDATTDVIYILHTQTYPGGKAILLNNAASLTAAAWNPSDPVRFTIHGWNNNVTSTVNTVAEYLARGNYNHIVVDWSAGAVTSNYISARNRVFETAQQTAFLATFLVNVGGSSYSNMHLIGHSLGGQMVGLIGQHLGGGVIGACIALDAAASLFSSTNITDRTSPDDCAFVEVVHTSIIGYGDPIGHADYYPNGGRSQPNCPWDWLGMCAHGRALAMFKKSLTLSSGFAASKCTTTVAQVQAGNCGSSGITNNMLAEPTDTAASGLYYLTILGLS